MGAGETNIDQERNRYDKSIVR